MFIDCEIMVRRVFSESVMFINPFASTMFVHTTVVLIGEFTVQTIRNVNNIVRMLSVNIVYHDI